MGIVAVNKFTLYGLLDHKESVLEGLQELGCAHLINLTPGTGEGSPRPGYSVEAHQALQYMLACPVQKTPSKNWKKFDFAATEREALDIQQKHRELADERAELLKSIEAVTPWGEFETPKSDDPLLPKFWFYKSPHYKMDALAKSGELKDLVWEIAAKDDRLEYIVILSKDQPQLNGVKDLAPVELDPRPLSELQLRVEEVDAEADHLQHRRAELTKWRDLMAKAMAEADNRAALEHAGEQTLDVSKIFALQGWAPRSITSNIEEFSQQHGLALSVSKPGPDDKPPTLLKNPELLAGGEAALTFYVTPGYGTWDPSIMFFFSFSAFFAMIFADAGYGFLLAAVLGLAWKKLSVSREMIRIRHLFTALTLSTITYGVAIGSYFGVTPPEGSFPSSLVLMDTSNQTGMMGLTIQIGMIHLILANLFKSWALRRTLCFPSPLGWIAMILGGYLFGQDVAGSGSPFPAIVSYALLGGGAATVLLFSSERKFTLHPVGIIMRLLDGLAGLTGASKAFGDILSYLRLFALGLASAQLAITFNTLAKDAAEVKGIGILFAIMILVLGHGLNFVLAVIGGVVHGLRLNCIEFLDWSLPDEGYAFQAFCKKASQ